MQKKKRQILYFISDLENGEMTPTLKQLWVVVKQLQKDVKQIKAQVVEERNLRCNLQEFVMSYLDKSGASKTSTC